MINMKTIFLSALFLLAYHITFAQSADDPHSLFTEILRDNVENGLVKYSKLKDDTRLDKYLKQLESTNPKKIENKEDRLAFWINAYNAFTLKFIVDEYPVESINDLHWGGLYLGSLLGTTVWDEEKIVISETELSLNEIEHEVIRKNFREERIHFAVVCASISCPSLRNEAYEGHRLDKQLSEQAELFFKDVTKNKFETKTRTAYLSKILNWYESDFGKNEQAMLQSITRFLDEQMAEDLKNDLLKWNIEYLPYDWDLNEF
jgi:hypothetical protein